MKIYRLYIKTTIEYEYINEDIEFFLSEENMQQFKKEFIKQHSRPDGSWIPNINYIDFYWSNYLPKEQIRKMRYKLSAAVMRRIIYEMKRR